jgi:peptidoglycan/LPS O-acetylase OafA/YrhL
VFILGIFGYLILRDTYPRKQIAIAGGSVFVILLLAFLYPAFNFPSNFIAGGLFTVFAILLANWPTRLLVNRVTTTLGKLSFSMYLTHFAVLTYFSKLGFSGLFPKQNIASLLYFLCVVLVAFVVSLIFYKYIEKPGIALGKRLIEKFEQDNVPNPNPAFEWDSAKARSPSI